MFSEDTYRALYYSFGSFATSVLHNLFVTFYVEMFLVVDRVAPQWFYFGQLLYCVWNTMNDPLFAWLGDRGTLGSRRLQPLRIGGPLWAAAYVMVWQQPEAIPPGVWFILCMIVYDGLCTYTTVAFSSLLADMTTSHVQREKCTMFGAAAHILGCGVVFLGHLTWDPKNVAYFRQFSLGVGVVTSVAFFLTTYNPYVTEWGGSTKGFTNTSNNVIVDRSPTSYRAFLRQIMRHDNLLVYAAFCLLQQFTCSFNTNFFSLIMTTFGSGIISHAAQSTVLGLSFVLPHFAVLLITPHLPRYEKTIIVRFLLGTRCVAGCTGLFILCCLQGGTMAMNGAVWILCGLFLTCRVLSECICRLQPLLLTDLVDEDSYLHRRPVSMAASVGGALSVVSKPGQSLAPVLGCWYLGLTRIEASEGEGRTKGSVRFFFAVQVMTSLVLLFVWGQYRLQGMRLQMVRKREGVLVV